MKDPQSIVTRISIAIAFGLAASLALMLLLSRTRAYSAPAPFTYETLPSPAHALASSSLASRSPQVALISSSAESLVFEITTPHYLTESVVQGREACTMLSVEGYGSTATPGQPRLPVRGLTVGVPMDADLSVRILDADVVPLAERYAICPIPTLVPDLLAESPDDTARSVVFVRDPVIYGEAGLFPTAMVELVTTGLIRSQRIAKLNVYPFLYEPLTGSLQHVERIRFEILFSPTSAAAGIALSPNPPVDEGAFEGLLQRMLANYEDARQWRARPLAAQTPSAAQMPSGVQTPAAVQTAGASLTGAPAAAYRVEIREAGLHRITYMDLLDAGADPSRIDPSRFRMSNLGAEVALLVTGEENGTFGPTDEILFYAEERVTKYANTNTYWLTWDSPGGERMPVALEPVFSDMPGSSSHWVRRHIEQNQLYLSGHPSGGDYWYYTPSVRKGSPQSYSVPLRDLSTDQPYVATLTGVLKGRSIVPTHQHSVRISLNNHQLFTDQWPSNEAYTFTVPFPSTHLNEGANTIRVEGGISSTSDLIYVNWFKIDYLSEFTAREDELQFTIAQTGAYTVSGFTTATLHLFDITAPKTPKRVSYVSSYDAAHSTYTLVLQHPTDEERTYLALSDSAIHAPASVRADRPSDLRNTQNQADYLIITHADFYTAVVPLADHHGARGLTTHIVDVQDVYDEFNHGLVDAEAIRDFIRYTYEQWRAPAPSYVLLVGDGNIDPTNYRGFGETSYIPPYLAHVDPWRGEVPADNRYVAVSGADILPDMHLGRLPVKTLAEAGAAVAKILAYDSEVGQAAEWQGRVLFVAGRQDDQAGNFHAYSNIIADRHLPAPYQAQKVYYNTDTYPTASAVKTAIAGSINQGTLIANYIGHGAIRAWANNSSGSPQSLFHMLDIYQLTNGSRLPFLVPMTCDEGYYIGLSSASFDGSSMGETFARVGGKGAIASWSPTGWGLASTHDYLNRALFDAIFKEDVIELGSATTMAKYYLAETSSGSIYDLALIDTYLLFGDPATRLAILPVDLEISTEVVGGQTVHQAGDTISYRLTYANQGPATAHRVVISDPLPIVLHDVVVSSSGAEITHRAGSALVWDVADLPEGSGGIITITGKIGAYAGPLVNTATIATSSLDSDPLNNTAAVTTTVIAPDVRITKSAAPLTPLQPGDTLTYTLVFRNAGTATARDVVITDILSPAHANPVLVSATGVPITARPGSPFVWDVGDLAPQASGTLIVRATMSHIASGFVTNTATISTSSFESNDQNNSAQTTVEVRVPDLAISKHAAPGMFLSPGDPLTYTLVFTNVGSITAQQVVITDILPIQLLDPQVIASSLPIAPRAGSSYVWDIGDLAPSASGAITIAGFLDPDFEGTVTNRAVIGSASHEHHLENNTGTAVVKVAWLFTDLILTQHVLPSGPLRSGDPITFTLVYTNTGPASARHVVITNPLSSLVQNPLTSTSGASMTLRTGSRYVWDVEDLESGEGGSITIAGVLAPTHTGYLLTNTAYIGTTSVEISELNNETVFTAWVSPYTLHIPILLRQSPQGPGTSAFIGSR